MEGLEIKRQREALKLTQKQLAEWFEVSEVTISRWERGAIRPLAPGMLKLAFTALDITLGLEERADELRRLQAEAEERMAALKAKLRPPGTPEEKDAG